MAGTLYLIPTPLGDGDTPWLPEGERARVTHLTHFVVEAEKTARKHLKQLGVTTPIRELVMHTLNEHTKPADVAALLAPLAAGQDLGLVSEAGCPAVADPGAQLVALAHEKGYRVEPLIGPSSILLAMMASGANGQCFAFHGYLPVDGAERAKAIKALELRSKQNNETQLFIETPYRPASLLDALLQGLRPATVLATASGLTLESAEVRSASIKDWRQRAWKLAQNVPTVFAIGR